MLSLIHLGTVELAAERMLDREEVDPCGHSWREYVGSSGRKSLDSLGLEAIYVQ